MGIAQSALVAVSSILIANSSLVGVADNAPDATRDLAFIESVSFDLSLKEFERTRFVLRRQQPWFDWTTDGCSVPIIGNEGKSFNFSAACRRHDFGYRNLKLLDRRYNCAEAGSLCGANSWSYGQFWNSQQRARVDQQFQRDMFDSCASRAKTLRLRCDAWAATFFQTVRTIGGP